MKHIVHGFRVVLMVVLAFSMVAIHSQEARATNGCYFEFTKSADKAVVTAGEYIVYSLHLKNIGTANCTGGGVELVETYDAKTAFQNTNLTPFSGNSVWNFGTIVPGQEHNFTVTVKVNNTVQPGDVITNRACVWAEQFGDYSDSGAWICKTATSTVPGGNNDNPGDNPNDNPTVTVATTGGGGGGPNGANVPRIKLSKKAHQPVAFPGQTIQYTLTVFSTGTKNADDVSVEDTLPLGFTYKDFGGTTKTWWLGNIVTGSNQTITYSVLVSSTTPIGVYENIAVATMKDGFAPDNRSEARASVSVQDSSSSMNVAKLALDKTVTVSKVLAGDALKYSLTVKNIGVTKAVNVTIKDVLPSGFLFVEFRSSEHTFMIGDLDIGAEKTITYTVSTLGTLATGVYRNVAVAQADNTSAVTDQTEVYVENPNLGLKVLPKTGINGLGGLAATVGAIAALILAIVIVRKKFSSSVNFLDLM